MTAGPPSASDPQSPPRDIPAMPDPNRPRPEPAEGEELHWPDVPINEVPDDEREALLAQAGPVGEQARLAWNAYQADNPEGDDPAAVARERQRLAEMGMAPPEEATGTGTGTATAEIDTPEEEAAETGTQTERQAAEAKAAERGLEIRDFGTAGDWRVYDPATGRQVAKSRLDEPV